ncbi:hypothetical protein GQ53DRAFT_596286, partial [Thozetella sp. PMI_491]
RWVLEVLLFLIIIGLLADKSYSSTKPHDEFEFAGDITGFAPKMSQEIKVFSPDPGFVPENATDFFTDAVKKKWLGIVPKGLGFVKVEQPEMYRHLPTPIEGLFPTTFTTSMTHQLHCLHSISQTLAAISSGNPDKYPHKPYWHLAHCIDMIRQGIMCCGDIALEGQETTFPEGVGGTDGWDATHVCKSYDEIISYLEKERQNSDRWI